MQNLRYNNVIYNDNANGDGGMRISFFCQGCNLNCEGCFNPQTHDFNGGKKFDENVVNEIVFSTKLYNQYYKGLNLLGGECFDNLEVALTIAQIFKDNFPQKDIWVWSGYTFDEIIQDKDKLKLLKICDVLIDGKYQKNKKDVNLKWRGSSNQRIISVQESLKHNKVVLYMD